MIFIFTRLILKGFLVATYQWYTRKIKGQTCFSLSELLRKKRRKGNFLKLEEMLKKRKGTNNKTRCQKSFEIGQSHRAFYKHVTFKDMFAEVLSIMKQLFRVCCSSFIFLSSRLCGCSCHSIWQCIKLLQLMHKAVSQGECRSSTAKISWVDACEDWQVVRWSGSQTSSDNAQGVI